MNEGVLNQHIQDCFVFLSITDTNFLSISRGVVKPTYFSSSVTENIVSLCYRYFDQFKEAPANHLHDELARFLENKPVEEKQIYIQYLQKIQQMHPPNKGYTISRINEFVKARTFEEAAIEFVRLTEKGQFEEAKELMMHTLKVGIESEEVGLKYFSGKIPTYYGKDRSTLFEIGISAINKKVHFRRKQLVVVLGGHKGKKSWFCIHLARQALLNKLNVLHITHEMGEDECEERYDKGFGGLVNKEKPTNVTFTHTNQEGEIIKTEEKEMNTIFNIEKVMGVRKLHKKMCGKLIIKKYPMGSCSMHELNRYLDYLEVYEEFTPDVVINDYADIMKPSLADNVGTRDKLNQIYIDHKRLADERNLLIITPSQTTRQALEKVLLNKRDVAEDIRKVGNCDLMIGAAQNEDLAEENRMRIGVIASRTDEDGFSCFISQNLDVGQFVIDSWYPKKRKDD